MENYFVLFSPLGRMPGQALLCARNKLQISQGMKKVKKKRKKVFVTFAFAHRIWLPLRSFIVFFFFLLLSSVSHFRNCNAFGTAVAVAGNRLCTHTMAKGKLEMPLEMRQFNLNWHENLFYKWINMFFSANNRRKRKFLANWCLSSANHFHIVRNLLASADSFFIRF